MSALRRLEGLLRSLAFFFRRKEEPDDFEFLIEQIERSLPALYGREGPPVTFAFHGVSLEPPLATTPGQSLCAADYEIIESMKATRRELQALLYSGWHDPQEIEAGSLEESLPREGGPDTR